jgi:hypothetical protein
MYQINNKYRKFNKIHKKTDIFIDKEYPLWYI